MSDRIAFYDDLAIKPERDFELALRDRLEQLLVSERPTGFDVPIDEALEMTITTTPPEAEQEARHARRSTRSMIAVAAAIAASVGVGVAVDELVIHDVDEPPALTVPAPTLAPTTVPSPTTFQMASDALLSDADVDAALPGYSPRTDRVVKLDGGIADDLRVCQPFASTVFESDRRPAERTYREFGMDGANFMVMIQYVTLHPTVEQAAAMLDGMQDPAFLGECLPAYLDQVPTLCCENLDFWTPVFDGEELPTPAIDVAADDVWVRHWTGHWSGVRGRLQWGPMDMVSAAVRVGRIVTLVDVALTDEDGNQRVTMQQFEAIVQSMAARAAQAQAVS